MKQLIRKPSKQLLLLIVLPIILGITGFGISYAFNSRDNPRQVNSSAGCQGTCIALRAEKADPDTITVVKDSYVQFNSADGKPHNLSSGKGGEEHEHKGKFQSGEFKADEGWRVQLTEEGTFFFHDHLNPKINVLVVVYTPGKDYKIKP